jgi:hypothetical protein
MARRQDANYIEIKVVVSGLKRHRQSASPRQIEAPDLIPPLVRGAFVCAAWHRCTLPFAQMVARPVIPGRECISQQYADYDDAASMNFIRACQYCEHDADAVTAAFSWCDQGK